MAGSSGTGDASFDVSLEMDSDEEFGGFYARDVELVEERIRDRPGEFDRESNDKVDISDFENSNYASSDDDTMILDPDDLDAVPVLCVLFEHSIFILFADCCSNCRLADCYRLVFRDI